MSAVDAEEEKQPVQSMPPEASNAKDRQANTRGVASNFARNSFISIIRLFVAAAVALILPGYLSHKLPVQTYAAWVLILQLGAYVAYLEFGAQSGISKYVAEFDAKNDASSASMHASVGMVLLLAASAIGTILTLILAWQVPRIFQEMPASLYRDVQISILFVGISLSFNLLCSTFASIFFGLQRYAVPMIAALVNKVLFTIAVLAAVALHQSLAVMGALAAIVNIFTGLLQFVAWRRWAQRIQLSLLGLDFSVIRKMCGYCFSLALWTVGMLCVSGLDVTIVGKYDFGQTAFYSIASMPTSFIIAISGAALAPLMPTASALSVHRTPEQMGAILSRATRYTTTLLLLSGLPLLVAGYPALHLWVGPVYAAHTIDYLRILVLANILRNICLPYANMLVATGSQKIATEGVIAEAIVNLSCSIYFVRHIGAVGVAYGTLLGAFVSVGVHLTLNMRRTHVKFAISRTRVLWCGLIRPGAVAIPSLLFIPYWWSSSEPNFGPFLWALWGLSTLLLAWFSALSSNERASLVRLIRYRLNTPLTVN